MGLAFEEALAALPPGLHEWLLIGLQSGLSGLPDEALREDRLFRIGKLEWKRRISVFA
jgi:hypothetical protein